MSSSAEDDPYSRSAILIYIATLAFYTVVYMVLMVLPFHAEAHGADKNAIGLIMGITMFSSMFSRPVAGRLVDRFGAVWIFVGALLIFALSLLGYFSESLLIYGAVRAVQGIVAAFFSTAMEIVTIGLLSARSRGQGLSLYSLATMVPTTFGPAAALTLKESVSMHSLFLFFVLLSGANVVFGAVVAWRGKRIKEAAPPRPDARIEKGAWRNRALVVASTTMMLTSIANGAIFTFLPLFLESRGSKLGSVYFLVQTVTLMLCRFVGGKRIASDGSLHMGFLGLLIGMAAIGALLISATVATPVLLGAAVLNGISFALMYPTLLTYVSFHVPEKSRGFLLSLFIGAADFGFALGALAMGPLAEHTSYEVMYVTCACICLLALGAAVLAPRQAATLAQPSVSAA